LTSSTFLNDDGTVTQYFNIKSKASFMNGAVVVNSTVYYERYYTGKFKYTKVTQIDISTKTSSGFKVDDMMLTGGQNDIENNREIKIKETNKGNLVCKPGFKNRIIDYGEDNFTVIGAYIDITFSRNSGKKYTAQIINQLYQNEYVFDGEIYQGEVDLYGILVESLQRGER